MRSKLPVFLVLAVLAMLIPALAQRPAPAVPKYDKASETVFKGTVVDLVDRMCPVSGAMGAHIILGTADGKTIEVHLATTKFVKDFEMIFHKGDEIEVRGVKVNFEGKDTIFAREVTRNGDLFVFRDKDGRPAW